MAKVQPKVYAALKVSLKFAPIPRSEFRPKVTPWRRLRLIVWVAARL